MILCKVFDEESEKDLEYVLNKFLKESEYSTIIDIKYQINMFISKDNEQIYCYSALVIYKEI